jgi:hypothetical protein
MQVSGVATWGIDLHVLANLVGGLPQGTLDVLHQRSLNDEEHRECSFHISLLPHLYR